VEPEFLVNILNYISAGNSLTIFLEYGTQIERVLCKGAHTF
jgi:hypothetical protein